MSALRIYGIARTRAFRVLWIAKELDLQSPFETNQPVSVDYIPGLTPQPAKAAADPAAAAARCG